MCLTDFKDQRATVRDELWLMKGKLKQLKEGKERLEASGLGQRSGHAGLVASCSVSGESLPKGAVADPNSLRKRGKHKPKMHPSLPSKERQEYYK